MLIIGHFLSKGKHIYSIDVNEYCHYQIKQTKSWDHLIIILQNITLFTIKKELGNRAAADHLHTLIGGQGESNYQKKTGMLRYKYIPKILGPQ